MDLRIFFRDCPKKVLNIFSNFENRLFCCKYIENRVKDLLANNRSSPMCFLLLKRDGPLASELFLYTQNISKNFANFLFRFQHIANTVKGLLTIKS